MTTGAARNVVLDTPELLEHIISYLPAVDILASAQRVSRSWKSATDSSPAIRNGVWMRTQPTKPRWPAGVFQASAESTRIHITEVARALKNYLPVYRSTLLFNTPLIAAVRGRQGPRREPPMYIKVFRIHVGDSTDVVKVCLNQLYLKHLKDGERPSWFDMHLTEPPITVAQVLVCLPRSSGYAYVPATVYHDTGLTFAAILDTVARMTASVPSTWDIGHRGSNPKIWFIADKIDRASGPLPAELGSYYL